MLDSVIMPLFTEGYGKKLSDYLNDQRAGKYVRTTDELALGPSTSYHKAIATQAGLRLIGDGDDVGAHDHGLWTWAGGRCVLYYKSVILKLYTPDDQIVLYPNSGLIRKADFRVAVNRHRKLQLAAKRATAELISPMLESVFPNAAVLYTYGLDTDSDLTIYSPV